MRKDFQIKEVASRLGVTEKTRRSHASNLFAKLGVHDRASAVEMAHSRQPLQCSLMALYTLAPAYTCDILSLDEAPPVW